jgi:ribonuclease BN (tRNA processing enzyme)
MEIVKPEGKLSLTNNGELEIFFIGVGSANATKHFQTNFIIVKGPDHIMVDFGSKAQLALARTARLTLSDIRVVLPTHTHADHINGLAGMAEQNRYADMKFRGIPKLKMVVTEEFQRIIWENAIRGNLENNEEYDGRRLCLTDFFDIIRPQWKTHQPREIHQVDVGGIHLELFRTKHTPEQSGSWETSFVSYGLFIDDRIFLSCDTRFDPELIEMYNQAEYFFHDVQFFPGAVHSPLADMKKILPAEVKRRMILMHYADNYDQQDISNDFFGWAQQGARYIF